MTDKQPLSEYLLDNLRLRTKFLKENAEQVDEAAQDGRAPGLYWRLCTLAGMTEATVRDLRPCAMVTDAQRERLGQVQDKLAEAEQLLRECYDTEQEASRTQR